jgi:hypothetical protein
MYCQKCIFEPNWTEQNLTKSFGSEALRLMRTRHCNWPASRFTFGRYLWLVLNLPKSRTIFESKERNYVLWDVFFDPLVVQKAGYY